MTASLRILGVLACAHSITACAAAPEDPARGSSSSSGGSSDGGSDDGVLDPAPEVVPQGDTALQQWLPRALYRDWPAESAIHPSAGPHGGSVRTFVDPALFESLQAGSAEHPVGASVVKELYSGGAPLGWAVMVKIEPGAGGDAWYWYERSGSSVYADGPGEALCTGCHSAGVDFVRTPFPLQ